MTKVNENVPCRVLLFELSSVCFLKKDQVNLHLYFIPD